VSGDVVLTDTPDGTISRLLHAASSLFAQPSFRPAALVGGLAVTMRLATVHRATVDVDAVTDGEGPRLAALEYVGEADGSDSSRIEFEGVKIDLLSTSALPASFDELPDDDLQRLFVLGHRWALESAEPLTVRVEPAHGGPAEHVTLPVATAPALVACKFHAIADRRDARSEKRESDALDLVRLTGDLVRRPESIALFARAPFDLVGLVADQTQRWLLDGATRTAGFVSRSAPADAILEPVDIAEIGRLFIEALPRLAAD
jgi:Nucleotidyl transferase AbiEii toxin, Type IV TA system